MKTKTKTLYTLEINPDEALWLKTLCQNAYQSDERPEDLKIRNKFWCSLPTIPQLKSIVNENKTA